MNEDLERESLELLAEMQPTLAYVLKALVGTKEKQATDVYLFHVAKHISKAAEAFVQIRKSGNRYASKILVRSALETMFRMEAVRKDPPLLYRVAYTEYHEDARFVHILGLSTGVGYSTSSDKEKIRDAFQLLFPNVSLVDEKLTLRETARVAGLENDYSTYYPLYCKFTHAALRAATGSLNHFDFLDNWVMGHVLLKTLEASIALGGLQITTFPYRHRLEAMQESVNNAGQATIDHFEAAPP